MHQKFLKGSNVKGTIFFLLKEEFFFLSLKYTWWQSIYRVYSIIGVYIYTCVYIHLVLSKSTLSSLHIIIIGPCEANLFFLVHSLSKISISCFFYRYLLFRFDIDVFEYVYVV